MTRKVYTFFDTLSPGDTDVFIYLDSDRAISPLELSYFKVSILEKNTIYYLEEQHRHVVIQYILREEVL